MKILTANLAVFYGISSESVLLEVFFSESVLQTRLTGQIEERTAIRHGTACKSNIPEWAGRGVGVVGIVYLAWEVMSVMSGPCRGLATPPASGTKHRHKATDDR